MYLISSQLVIFEKYRDGSIELKNIFHAIHQRLIDIYIWIRSLQYVRLTMTYL